MLYRYVDFQAGGNPTPNPSPGGEGSLPSNTFIITGWDAITSRTGNAKRTRDVAPLPAGGGVGGGVAPAASTRTTTRLVVLLLTLLPFCLSAQTKSAVPLTQNSKLTTQNSTRAVVVGISDYQHKDIPDLRFADADAEAFAAWLKSPAGGSMPDDNITLLINTKATLGNFAMALDGLLDNCREGDRAIIYFSGHGDVERKTISQPGYLLCKDAPAACYMSGGAFNLRDLQEIISTLSLQNKVHVLVITDACHAGKLAGSAIGGAQITGQNLAAQFANEVKIMSCQPNELSLESEQWGGGHGVFSYHLVRGLTGLADRDTNGSVTLFEIGRYLEDAVPADVAPMSQLPQVVGEKQTPLNQVDAPSLALLQKEKAGGSLLAAGSKGLEDEVLAKADSAERRWYFAFKEALTAGNLLEPADACANVFHAQLVANEKFKPLAGLMTRNFAAALIDEVQQALNALLDNDPYAANTWAFNPQRYGQYPAYLARTIELLGEGHYMTRPLRAKQLFFEGLNRSRLVGEFENEPARRDSLKNEAKKLLLQSFALDPEAAYVPQAIGSLYLFNAPPQTDSVLLWCSRAVALSPTWLAPYLDLAHEFLGIQGDFAKAEKWILRAQAQDSTAYVTLERLSWLRQWQLRPEESLALSDQMIALKPDLFNAWSTKASTLYWMLGDYKASEKCCLRSLELNPNQYWWAYYVLGLNYTQTRRSDKAIAHFQTGIPAANAFEKGYLYTGLVEALVQTGQYEQAEKVLAEMEAGNFGTPCYQTWVQAEAGRMWLQRSLLEKAETVLRHALSIDPTLDPAWIQLNAHLGEVKKRQGKPAEAEAFFQKAIFQEKTWESYPFLDEAHLLYGQFLLTQNREAEAIRQFEKCREYRPNGWRQAYGFALLAAKNGRKAEALDWLEKSLDRYLPRKALVLEEPLFKKIRKTKRFEELMAKHFPEITKR